MGKSLNELTDDDLKTVTDLAALFFTPSEISIMLELDDSAMVAACKMNSHKVYKAFQSGYLQGQIDLRTGIMKMAKAGSSPAQTMALDILKNSKSKMIN
jgi:hypothetical protein